MWRKLVLLVSLVSVGIMVGPANAAVIFHWELDGTMGQDIVSDTDIVGNVTAKAFTDTGGGTGCSLKYDEPNPTYNENGGSAHFRNLTADNDPGMGLFANDTGVDCPLDLTGLGEFTIEAFINVDTFRQSVIVRKYDGGAKGRYYLEVNDGGVVGFCVSNVGSDENKILSSGGLETGTWYHVAGVFDANDTEAPLKLYIDGVLAESGGEAQVLVDSDRGLGIGCILRDNLSPPGNSGQFFHGMIDELRISDEALSPEQFMNAAVAGKTATKPVPSSRLTDVCPDGVVLSWTPGVDVAATEGHDVYLGTDYDAVKAATTSSSLYKGAMDANRYPEAGTLAPLDLAKSYYWRIDEVNDGSVVFTGAVWTFTTQDGNALDLIPGDGYKGADPNGVLRWTASCLALSHNVYLGTNLVDVNTATNPLVLPGRGNQTETTYDPGGLLAQTTYYWRIDEITSRGTFKGRLHTFKTGYGGILVYFSFDGTKGNNLPSEVTDLTGRVTFKKYIAEDPEDAGTVKYGDANPFYNTAGTSADIMPEAGLYRLDPEPNTPVNPDILRLDGMAYTIEMWMRAASFPSYDNNVLIKKYDSYSIEISGDDGDIVFYHAGDSASSDAEVQANEWYHIAAVCDLGDPEESMKLYVDGVLVDTDNPSETNPSDNNDPVGIGFMARPWDEEDGYTYDDFFDGEIDELMILDIPLDLGTFKLFPGLEWANTPSPYDKERRVDPCDPNLALNWVPGVAASSHQLYFGTSYEDVRDATTSYDPGGVWKGPTDPNTFFLFGKTEYAKSYYWRVEEVGTPTRKGLVWKFTMRSAIVDPNMWLWYKFDEGSGTKVHDSSGRDFESSGAPSDGWDPNGGQWGGALYCDDDAGMSVSSDEVLSNITNSITVSVWLKDSYRQGNDNWVFDGGRNSSYRVQAAVVTEDGMALWRAGNDSNDQLVWDLNGVDPSRLEGWHHWAFVKDEAAGTISMYFDADLVDSNNRVVADLTNVQNGAFKIAAVTNHSTDLKGWIDDFRLYDYAKSATEIMMLYRGGDLALAWKPKPFDGEPDVLRDTKLSWKPGDYAQTTGAHKLYFGTSWEDVNSMTDPCAVRNRGDENYDPGIMELGKKYYWRVDEVNEANDKSPWKGRVWSFTVADYLLVEDFESYDFFSELITDTWWDGIRFVPPYYFEYVNGATVALAASYTAPPEPVHRGKQSMGLWYDNGGLYMEVPYYSETERRFDSPQDWTEAEVEILTLFFYGDPNNDANATEQMYAALGDADSNAVVKYGYYADEDMNDIKKAEWHEWNIALSDFSGITLTAVKRMYIGLGDRDNHPTPGGWGVVYFDNIRLYQPKCIVSRRAPAFAAVDFSGDCAVGFADIRMMAVDWLRTDVNFNDLGLSMQQPASPVAWWKLDESSGTTVSDSAGSNHGAIEGSVSRVTGYDGVHKALEFDGGKVVVPDAEALRPQNALSVSAWIKFSDTPGSARLVVKGADNKETFSLEVNSDKALTFLLRDVNNADYNVESADELSRNEWIHVAGTYDANRISSYVNGEVDETKTVGAHPLSQDANNLAMGNRADALNRPYEGCLDDVRLYNYGLSAAEARYLATDGTGYVPLRSQFNLYGPVSDKPQVVNLKDVAELASSWLKEELWPAP
ncbi:MAG TPA: LamG domain-containing protein [Sedimentisphaerales bacterium]|nr:LamG domain-containing protein [Sedimentisphaerales bacterium]